MRDRPVTKAEHGLPEERRDIPGPPPLGQAAAPSSPNVVPPAPRAPAPRGRPARALLLIALGAFAVGLLIEWLGWRINWRLGVPRELGMAWWVEFARGALRTAGSAAIVSAAGVVLIALLPAGRRWLRPRLIPVFAAGTGLFLTLLLLLTMWGSWRVP